MKRLVFLFAGDFLTRLKSVELLTAIVNCKLTESLLGLGINVFWK